MQRDFSLLILLITQAVVGAVFAQTPRPAICQPMVFAGHSRAARGLGQNHWPANSGGGNRQRAGMHPDLSDNMAQSGNSFTTVTMIKTACR